MSTAIMLFPFFNVMNDPIYHIHSFHEKEYGIGTSLCYRVGREIFPLGSSHAFSKLNLILSN